MDKLSSRSTSPIAYKAYLRKQAQDELKQFKSSDYNTDTSALQSMLESKERDIQEQQASITLPDQNPLAGMGETGGEFQGPMPQVGGQQRGILGAQGPVTQRFGNYNPGLYAGINQSMRNTGTDFGVPVGTPLAVPQGEWEVVEAFSGAKGPGSQGNMTNSGYGNSVLVRNRQTGEMMRYSHLSKVGVRPGQVLKGGSVLGASGDSGNVTGAHLDLEFYDQLGRLADVMNSNYAQSLFGQGGGGATNGQGGGVPTFEAMKRAMSGVTSVNVGAPMAQPQSLSQTLKGIGKNVWDGLMADPRTVTQDPRYDESASFALTHDLANFAGIGAVAGGVAKGASKAGKLAGKGDDALRALKRAGNVAEERLTDIDPLINEAKKYKTADEFIEAQGEPLFHGTQSNFKEFELNHDSVKGLEARGVFFSKDWNIAQSYGMNVKTAFSKLNNPLKIDFEGKSTVFFDGSWRRPSQLSQRIAEINEDIANGRKLSPDLARELKEVGWSPGKKIDGAIMDDIDDMGPYSDDKWIGSNVLVSDPSKIKTREQLRELWESSNVAQQQVNPLARYQKKNK